MDNYDNAYSDNIINIEDLRLKRLMDKNHCIREFGDRYEYCFIKEYENKYENFTSDSIKFEDIFVQILTVNDEHKLVSIDFSKKMFKLDEVLSYLNLYGVKLLKEGELKINKGNRILEAKRFEGTPIVVYERGTDSIHINHEELIEITEEFVYNQQRINTANSKPRDSTVPKSKIFLNGEEIDYVPEFDISVEQDLIISNGHIMVANYIGDYFGCIGFYEEKDYPLPISWIFDKNTTVYIEIYEKEEQRIIVIDHNYAIDFEELY